MATLDCVDCVVDSTFGIRRIQIRRKNTSKKEANKDIFVKGYVSEFKRLRVWFGYNCYMLLSEELVEC